MDFQKAEICVLCMVESCAKYCREKSSEYEGVNVSVACTVTERDWFPHLKPEQIDLLFVVDQKNTGRYFSACLECARTYRKYNPDGVAVFITAEPGSDHHWSQKLRDCFNHVVYVAEEQMKYEKAVYIPVEVAAKSCEEGYMGIDYADIRRIFRQSDYSVAFTECCHHEEDFGTFLTAWGEKIEKHVKIRNADEPEDLLWIAINEDNCKQMHFLNATEVLLAQMIEHTRGQITTIGTFEEKQKNFLEVSVLLMHPSVSL